MINSTYREIGSRLLAAQTILIFPHINVDGDAIGSASALCMALRRQGCDAWVLCHEPTPKNLAFLEYGCVTRDPEIFPDGADAAVFVDCSSLPRIRGREEAYLRAKQHAVIDHHGVSEGDVPFDYGIVEPESAATGELVWLLLREMGWELDLSIANALFAAITTDTGNFQHANTTKRTHEMAASLYDVPGFDSKPVSSLIYDRNSFALLRLESMVIGDVRMLRDGTVAIGAVTRKMLAETGCSMDETDGFVQKLMSINGVEAACMLKEAENGQVRISLRARSRANVANVAVQFGGGGHIRAAGATSDDPMDVTMERIGEALIAELDRTECER